eukprot:3594918-Pyramimonas_sp.AAC.1
MQRVSMPCEARLRSWHPCELPSQCALCLLANNGALFSGGRCVAEGLAARRPYKRDMMVMAMMIMKNMMMLIMVIMPAMAT